MGNSVFTDSLKGRPVTEFFQEYKLTDKVLGKGGFGEVRLAQSTEGVEYAVKVISKDILYGNEVKAQELYNEVTVLQKLEHPNIVKYFDFFEDKKQFLIVMSAGKVDLFEYLCNTDKHTENDCKRIIRKVTEALKHCHDAGVVHRDLKPENILVGDSNTFDDIALIDFGFSKEIESKDTRIRTKCGTLSYVAPEVIKRNSYTHKCDIWSLGIVAYIIVSGGYHPFVGADSAKTRRNVERGLFKFGPDEAWDHVSDEAKNFIECCLNRDPSKRYSCDELLEHEWIAGDHIFQEYTKRDSRDPIRVDIDSIQKQLRADMIKGIVESVEEDESRLDDALLDIGRPVGSQVTFFEKGGRELLDGF